MEEISFKNSNERFTFFTDEEDRFCISVFSLESKEKKAGMIMAKEDVDEIKAFIDKVYDTLEE